MIKLKIWKICIYGGLIMVSVGTFMYAGVSIGVLVAEILLTIVGILNWSNDRV